MNERLDGIYNIYMNVYGVYVCMYETSEWEWMYKYVKRPDRDGYINMG